MAGPTMLNTTFPVSLPELPELRLNRQDFEEQIRSLAIAPLGQTSLPIRAHGDDTTTKTEDAATLTTDRKESAAAAKPTAPFMTGLLTDSAAIPSFDSRDSKMLTENADVAYRDSGEALVDLFYELEDTVSAERLKELLEKAWRADSAVALKIIWNARSIHLGKSNRRTFYRALGWLAENHPHTLLVNLQWLVRPIIRKKAPKSDAKEGETATKVDTEDADSDFEMVDDYDKPETQPEKKVKIEEDVEMAEFDIKYGVAHGYWKDLLNILSLAADDELKVDGNPATTLSPKPTLRNKSFRQDWTEDYKKKVNSDRHARVVEKLEKRGFYRALHLTVARLFADQLKLDLARLQSGSAADRKRITLAGKWAPSHKGTHDQHTCIVSTIAETLYPLDTAFPDLRLQATDRKLYLKHARIAYQSQTLSPLRKQLDIIERYITEENFSEIKYDRVPSLALNQYSGLFAEKDYDHFDQYLEKVASGRAQISGAALFPSTLVAQVPLASLWGTTAKDMVAEKIENMKLRAADGQWNTLVQRIKDSGTLSDSIAVCDVSGSMEHPVFKDGSTPLHSSIGLSLLIAEVTKPPFGGAFITFSESPEVVRVGGEDHRQSFAEKVRNINCAAAGMNTNFVAVFEKLILPMALENKLKQEDMVKQVFVFSDMQFDAAEQYCGKQERWTTSYERIRKRFAEAGYKMPRLIFWNLASRSSAGKDDAPVPKPVTAAEENTQMVSGYSQGQMKMFLENGGFEDVEGEEVVEEEQTEDGEVMVSKNKKVDSLMTVKKAVAHEAYRMLRVVD